MNKITGKWKGEDGVQLLKKIGIKPGQAVLDFGCKDGNYSIPASIVIGETGVVYALDKDSESLDELMREAEKQGLRNIRNIDTSGELKIPLEDGSIDVALLYDVIHLVGKDDSSTLNDRMRLYQAIYRVVKENSLVSVYPTHLRTHTDVNSNGKIKKELEDAGFSFEREFYAELIHDNCLVKGYILNFRKTETLKKRFNKK